MTKGASQLYPWMEWMGKGEAQRQTSRIAMTIWLVVGLYAIRTTRCPRSIEAILLPVKASNSAVTNEGIESALAGPYASSHTQDK
jgi:hypothetical protein